MHPREFLEAMGPFLSFAKSPHFSSGHTHLTLFYLLTHSHLLPRKVHGSWQILHMCVRAGVCAHRCVCVYQEDARVGGEPGCSWPPAPPPLLHLQGPAGTPGPEGRQGEKGAKVGRASWMLGRPLHRPAPPSPHLQPPDASPMPPPPGGVPCPPYPRGLGG